MRIECVRELFTLLHFIFNQILITVLIIKKTLYTQTGQVQTYELINPFILMMFIYILLTL